PSLLELNMAYPFIWRFRLLRPGM
ncbi:MAG: hypothetical protein JWQ59_679, partial [Cryobacterium sp.]|nr:hypothetical protein [Cryobacterium sp.]